MNEPLAWNIAQNKKEITEKIKQNAKFQNHTDILNN